ncbi:MAG: hypothetical protein RL398_2292 [Planctomycetota bacterium]
MIGAVGSFPLPRVAEWSGVPIDVVRRWVEHGLLEPLPTTTQRFSFRALVTARTLAQFWRAGWTVPRLARAVAAVRPLEPDLDAALAGLLDSRTERVLALRSADGRLLEPGGQQLFDFADADRVGDGAGEPVPMRSPADWQALAVEAEAEGRLEAAASAYRLAAEHLGGEAWLALGNCLHALRRRGEAAHAFAAAVADRPDCAEAWNNLGIVRAELGDRDGAEDALRRALEWAPHFADAHFNLAELLAVRDEFDGARRHWQAYLAFDSSSRWAEQVRRRLRVHGRR